MTKCAERARPRCKLGDLRVVRRAGQRAVGHRRRAVAHRLGDGEQPFELDAPVPARDLALLARSHAEQRRIGVLRFKVRRDRRVVGQHCTVVGTQGGHGALRVDAAIGIAELFAAAQVYLHGLVRNTLLGKENARAAGARGGGAVIERDHGALNLSCVFVSKSLASCRSCNWLRGRPGSIDHAAALDCRALRDLVGPALHVGVLLHLQELTARTGVPSRARRTGAKRRCRRSCIRRPPDRASRRDAGSARRVGA